MEENEHHDDGDAYSNDMSDNNDYNANNCDSSKNRDDTNYPNPTNNATFLDNNTQDCCM